MFTRAILSVKRAPLKAIFNCQIFSALLSLLLISCGGGGGKDDEPLANACELFPAGPSAKIINGSDCTDRETPVARLDLFDDEDNRAVCSAIILAPRKALTAAHCYNELVFRAELVVNGGSVTVNRIDVHPAYTGRFVDGRLLNDLALIETQESLSGPFATLSYDANEPSDDILYGFGFGTAVVGETRSTTVGTLRAAVLKVSGLSDLFIFDSFSSADEGNVCFGDSGGPVFTRLDGEPVVVGITSTGTNSTCAVGDVSAFTRLSAPGVREFLER